MHPIQCFFSDILYVIIEILPVSSCTPPRKSILTAFLTNHGYLLIRLRYLLDTAHLFRCWSPIGYCSLHFLFCIDFFVWCLLFITAAIPSPILQTCDVLARNEVWFNLYTKDCLVLEVPVVSDRWYALMCLPQVLKHWHGLVNVL